MRPEFGKEEEAASGRSVDKDDNICLVGERELRMANIRKKDGEEELAAAN